MAKHTPGPWRSTGCRVLADVERKDGSTYSIIVHEGRTDGERHIADTHLIARSPSMLALLEKAHLMVEEEAERRGRAFIGDIPSVQPYWTEMRDLANEIRAEIDRAMGKAIPEPELCPHGFGFVEYCPDCKKGKGASDE